MMAILRCFIVAKKNFDKPQTVSIRKVAGSLDQCFNISLHNFT